MSASVQIEIPSKPGYVGVVRLALASLARKVDMDEERVDELKIAASEACTDAVLAHQEAGVNAPICVRWSQSDSRIVVEVEDQIDQASQPKLEDSQGFSTRHAMAAALLATLVDELDTHPGDKGTITRLTLNL